MLHAVADDSLLRRLVAAAAEGDDRALGRLVRETQPAMWRLCSLLGSAGEVEDLVQDTYLRAMGSLAGFRGEAGVLSWLSTIARRTCADSVRRRERHRRVVARIRAERPASPAEPGAATAALLDALPAERRDAFVLTQLMGLPYEEAAETLGCAVGTIRSRVSRARAELSELVRRAEAG
jgi:RNA polymerase sigma-70 factor (ECF subfamily)